MNEIEICLLALTMLVVCCLMLIGMLVKKVNKLNQNQRDVDPLGRTERFT